MIYEYALEPAVLISWASNDRDYAEFFREYGLGTPRIISSFPKKKKSKLRSYLLQYSPVDSQSLAAQRYVEMVQRVVESLVLRDVQEHEASSWIEKVVIENRRVPFDVILSLTSTEEQNSITPSSMYSKGSIWECPWQLNVQRTNDDFLLKVSNLIRFPAKEIVFIDPFGWKQPSIDFILNITRLVINNRLTSELPVINIVYKEGPRGMPPIAPDASYLKSKISELLDEDAASLQIKLLEVREVEGGDVFHNRCILTEHAGVEAGNGITLTNNEAHTDELKLLNVEIYQKKWRQFVDRDEFEVVSEAII